MSLMTCGVKIWLWPRMKRSDSAGTFTPLPFFFFFFLPSSLISKHQFLFGWFKIVVVPQLFACDDLAEYFDAAFGHDVVHAQFACQPLPIELGYLGPDRVHAEALRLAANIDRAVIHRVAEILAGVAADHHAPALHHEAGEGAGVATGNNITALHVDAGARADITLADEVAAADSGTELRAGVLLDQDGSTHHVLGAGPTDPAGDANIRTV